MLMKVSLLISHAIGLMFLFYKKRKERNKKKNNTPHSLEEEILVRGKLVLKVYVI
ncbi:hypothetical protein I79_001932 [Cricetulus griseus]|uniref:Uncharacterized protein n=1 Tax=Cricetulus griseus TaxID=10029 RepID=G3GW21_CRIGR|nr:hypothetical protein I79_001932 [Cricetulus griseus]